MQTQVTIDETLLAAAMAATGNTSRDATVEQALRGLLSAARGDDAVLAAAYRDGMASGEGQAVNVEEMLASLKERFVRRG